MKNKMTKQRPMMETRFARLLESELETTSLVLNAGAISDKLQKMAEDLAKIEPDDIMPLLSAFRDAFGPEVTDQFHKTTIANIRKLIDATGEVQQAIGTEVTRLEKTAAGEDTSDMATDSATMDDAGGDDVAMGAPVDGPPAPDQSDIAQDTQAMAGDAGAAPGDEDNMADVGHPGDDSEAMVGGNAAGRGKKMESMRPRGRRLREFADTFHDDSIDVLRAMEPKAAILATQIDQTISRAHLDDAVKRELSHALSHICGAASNSAHFEDPDQKVETTLAHAHLDARLPEVRTVTSMLKKLAHLIAFKHEGMLDDATLPVNNMMETVARNVRRLRESTNPDAMVLQSFRKRLGKGTPVFEAAARTARSYAIDVSDVASIVKEAKAAARPFVGKVRSKPIVEADATAPMFPVGAGGNSRSKSQVKVGNSRPMEVDEDDDGLEDAPNTSDGTSDQPALPNTNGSQGNGNSGNNANNSVQGSQGSVAPNSPQNSGTMTNKTMNAAPNAPQQGQNTPPTPKAAYAPKGNQQPPVVPGQAQGDDEEDDDNTSSNPNMNNNRAPNAPR